MPITREFTVVIEDRPDMMGKVCRALADHEVNILALQSFPNRGKFVVRLIVDDPRKTKTILDTEHLTYAETQIIQIKIQHRPGEIARLASRLGKAKININYAYCGLETGTNAPLVFFSVTEIGRAASILEQIAVAAGNHQKF